MQDLILYFNKKDFIINPCQFSQRGHLYTDDQICNNEYSFIISVVSLDFKIFNPIS